MFDSCQHMCNLEKSCRIHPGCAPSGNWGEWNCYARSQEMEHEVSGEWSGPGYLHYCGKGNGIRSANPRVF